MFLETSAMTGENVEEAFLKCAKCILAKIETGEMLFLVILFWYLEDTSGVNLF